MGKGRSGRRVLAMLAIAGLGLALTACGDDDDDDAAPAAEADEGDENAEAEDTGDEAEDQDEGDEGDGDVVEVDDIEDIPEECRELMGDVLERMEPLVEDVDWENADLSQLETLGEDLDAEFAEMEAEMDDAGCNDFELADDTSMEPLIEIAEDRAPGTVAYLEFIQRLQEDFSEVTIPDVTVPEGDDGEGEDAGDVPQDCQGAIDYVRGLMDEHDSMMEMSLSELTGVSNATTVISSQCTVDEMNSFFSDPEVSAWMSGT